jgi:hypothetical protein
MMDVHKAGKSFFFFESAWKALMTYVVILNCSKALKVSPAWLTGISAVEGLIYIRKSSGRSTFNLHIGVW